MAYAALRDTWNEYYKVWDFRRTVLIVGGGPSGLITALSLLKNGIRVRVIERRDAPHGGIRGTGITPRTLEIFASLGILDDVLAVSSPTPLMALHGVGTEITSVRTIETLSEESPTIPYRASMNLTQPQLESILRDHLEKQGVKVEYGSEMVGIEQNISEEYVTAKIQVGENIAEERFPYVVACDGGKGKTRRLLGISFLGETPGQLLLTANVDCEAVDRKYWHAWGNLTDKAVYLKPVGPAPLCQLIAGGDINPIPSTTEALQELFNETVGPTDLVFRNASWIAEWRANIRMADRFMKNRVFLVGECAHCHSPTGGQGINTAAMDSFNLAWKIALVMKGLASQSLLSTYETERRPVVAQMLEYTTALHRVTWNGSTSPRSGVGHQLGVNYRWSSIVMDGRMPEIAGSTEPVDQDPYGLHQDALRPGDRAPDSKVSGKDGETTLFKVMADCDKHHILVFGSRAPGVVQEMASALMPYLVRGVASLVVILARGPDVQTPANGVQYVKDAGGHAYKAYDAGDHDPVFVVVRPDGMIGAFAINIEQMEKYFSKFLSLAV